jgi:TRAP-type C4-dicarboxylate transport system substrate-binding protein
MRITTTSFAILAAALFARLLAGAPVVAQPLVWNLSEEYPATSIPGEGDSMFAALVRDKTAGRIVIEPKFDAALGFRSKQTLDAVAAGTVPLGDMYAGALGEAEPFFLLPSLPFLTVSIEQARLLYDCARPDYDAVLARHNQKLLFASLWPPSGIWATRPIADEAALRGLRIRTFDVTATETFRRLEAAPALISFADAMPRLRAGELDAVLSSGDGGAGARLWEILPHFTEVNYAMPLSIATIGLDAWRILPEELQAALAAAAAETETRQWQAMRGRVAANYQRMAANGVTITAEIAPALAARLRQTGAAAVDDWAARLGADGAGVLARYRGGKP